MSTPATIPNMQAAEMAGSMLELVELTEQAIKSAESYRSQVELIKAAVAAGNTLAVAADGSIEVRAPAKAANEAPKVVLQKVALDKTAVRRTVQALVDRSILPAEDLEKTAGFLLEDPSFALDLLDRVATLHEFPSVPAGQGIPKNAKNKSLNSLMENDPDGWGKVLTEGA